jgi:alkanesulfonate monooxygenase SsuD/methylene tetrahydromethanopterin reductase-like flavin-dependent oxidoreductase (luciferase family)
MARLVAWNISATRGVRATPLLPEGFDGPATIASHQATVINLVIKSLPSPDEDTPWERILEFRADESAQRALRRLRAWMASVVVTGKTATEIEDEFQSLLDSYIEHMQLHKMKTHSTALQTLITMAADIVENVAKLNFGTAARAAFSLREQKLHLIEAELKAPGREVAYIIAAQERFPGV